MEVINSIENTRKDWFPNCTTGKTWDYVLILEDGPTHEGSFYPKLLLLAYQITNNKTFLEEFKARVNIIKKLKSKKLKKPDRIDNFPIIFDSCFDAYEVFKDEDAKRIALKAMEEYASHITKEGLFKRPSDGQEAWYGGFDFDVLIRAYNLSKNKKFLDVVNRVMNTSIKYRCNSREGTVYSAIEKKGRFIKPKHKEIHSRKQVLTISDYSGWHNPSKNTKFLDMAQKIADTYMGWVKQHTKDLVPPHWMNPKEVEKDEKNSENIKAVEEFLELAQKSQNLEKAKQYETFAQQMMHSYVVNDYLILEGQGILSRYLNARGQDGSSIYVAYLLLNALQETINYEKQQLQLKQQQEQKQQEKGSMHESFFRNNNRAFVQFKMPRQVTPLVVSSQRNYQRKIPGRA